ncbi:MAG: hypothetical protein ACRD3N_11665 [Terracidiphilus sp.]
MLLELGKVLSFFLSLLSLCDAMMSAFFVPGTRWEDRLATFLLRIAFAGCICFASGIFFTFSAHTHPGVESSILSTLPVKLFFWALAGMALLFALSWYLDAYFVPLLWRNQP